MKSSALPKEALEANRRVRRMLLTTIQERGLKKSEVARRLGQRPEWIYKRFATESATLRFSFCIRVLLACKVNPADFFHRALIELEGPPPPAPALHLTPTRAEIHARLEPVVAELLAERKRHDHPPERRSG